MITVIAIEAEESRVVKKSNNRAGEQLLDVPVAMNAFPKVIIVRPDGEQITLMAKDRSMCDYLQKCGSNSGRAEACQVAEI